METLPARLAKVLPSPELVAEQARKLQDTLLAAINTEDIQEAMGAIIKDAKNGNIKAMKMLSELLGYKGS